MTFTPKTKNDRGALAKEHTTASTQNHQKEASIMPKSTFQPGELVRNTKTGELYRIATTDKKPGYVGYVRVTPKVEYIRPRSLNRSILTSAMLSPRPSIPS